MRQAKIDPEAVDRASTWVTVEGLGLFEKSTDGLTDTSNGWTDLTLDFTTGPKTSLLVVALERIPSQQLDNLIEGKVWIDDVRLTTVQNERQSSRGRTTP